MHRRDRCGCGIAVIALAQAAAEKGYAKGPRVMAHWANDGGRRSRPVRAGLGHARDRRRGLRGWPQQRKRKAGKRSRCRARLQQHGGVVQGRSRQEHLRFRTCASRHPRRRPRRRGYRTLPEHRHGERHHLRLDLRSSLWQEVMLKNNCFCEKSVGDEAGCARRGGGHQ